MCVGECGVCMCLSVLRGKRESCVCVSVNVSVGGVSVCNCMNGSVCVSVNVCV